MGVFLLSWKQTNILAELYIAFLTFSLVGSFSVLVVSIVKWRHLRHQVHLLVQLTLADLLASGILMSTSVMNKVNVKTEIGFICRYSLPLSLTFYLISFLLVVVYAWNSKNAIQGWRERAPDDEKRQTKCKKIFVETPFCFLVWLIPIALYCAYAIFLTQEKISQNDSANSCILFLTLWNNSYSGPGTYEKTMEKVRNDFIEIVLPIVLISVISSCSFIYYKVGRWYEERTYVGFFPVEGDGLSRRQFRRGISTARNMVLVIIICWVPALAVILLSVTTLKIEQTKLFPLYCIQAITVSLQGFLNSMVYAWKRPNFTEVVLGESTPLVGYSQKAFFEESLKS
ncbi:uncharacterized protein si:dkey-30c15.2 isoform X2 [Kryptolebias marmoratus]|uniref:uncharacterized protein si:dkey-30c15.2 isoform X2 n=1 Tax=Kryptolebias marmoratus TaxID=37003 RepID=UPI0007F92D7D|nr:uncharacterized protein si:dkey-30c15.2 isoform X2 [Kryptolebias marmoratus]